MKMQSRKKVMNLALISFFVGVVLITYSLVSGPKADAVQEVGTIFLGLGVVIGTVFVGLAVALTFLAMASTRHEQ